MWAKYNTSKFNWYFELRLIFLPQKHTVVLITLIFSQISHVIYCTGCHGLAFQPIVNKVVKGNSVKFNIPRYTSNGLSDAEGLCLHCRGAVQIAGWLFLLFKKLTLHSRPNLYRKLFWSWICYWIVEWVSSNFTYIISKSLGSKRHQLKIDWELTIV
jgi:hypothetical protein